MEWKKPSGKKIEKENVPAVKQIQSLMDNLEDVIKKLEKMKKDLRKK